MLKPSLDASALKSYMSVRRREAQSKALVPDLHAHAPAQTSTCCEWSQALKRLHPRIHSHSQQ